MADKGLCVVIPAKDIRQINWSNFSGNDAIDSILVSQRCRITLVRPKDDFSFEHFVSDSDGTCHGNRMAGWEFYLDRQHSENLGSLLLNMDDDDFLFDTCGVYCEIQPLLGDSKWTVLCPRFLVQVGPHAPTLESYGRLKFSLIPPFVVHSMVSMCHGYSGEGMDVSEDLIEWATLLSDDRVEIVNSIRQNPIGLYINQNRCSSRPNSYDPEFYRTVLNRVPEKNWRYLSQIPREDFLEHHDRSRENTIRYGTKFKELSERISK